MWDRLVKKNIMWFALVSVFILTFFSAPAKAAMEDLKFSFSPSMVYVDENAQFEIHTDYAFIERNVIWRSSDTSVASVQQKIVYTDGSGDCATTAAAAVVTGKRAGTTVISAEIEGHIVTCKVTVKIPEIKLSSTSLKIDLGEIYNLSVSAPIMLSNPKWTSSNPDIVSVDDGSVEGKKAGTAVISLTSNGATAKCNVTVKKPGIKLNKSKITLYAGTSFKLKAKVTGHIKTAYWTSRNPGIASVDRYGNVTAWKAGSTIITAEANTITVKCRVTVKKSAQKIKSKNASQLKKYEKFLASSRIKSSYGRVYSKSQVKFSLINLDSSGIPSLVVQYGDHEGFDIISPQNGTKAFGDIAIDDVDEGVVGKKVELIGYYKKTGVYATEYRCYYKGKLHKSRGYLSSVQSAVVKSLYKDLRSKTYSESINIHDYEHHYNRVISAREFKKLLKERTRGKKMSAIKWYGNTAENRKKYLK